MSNIFDEIAKDYKEHQTDEMTLQEYLELCSKDPMAYATAPERMLKAIGEAVLLDTSKDARLGRVFFNKTIKVYPSFDEEFYGMEDTIQQIATFYTAAAQGAEERKQILYLLGPVGGGKSSLSEHLKFLMEKFPIYVIKDSKLRTESPLGLFNKEKFGKKIEDKYGISQRYLGRIMSPHTAQKLREYAGDISKFKVVKLWPSKLHQIGIAKVEPGDPNTQDISSLVGRVDIRMLEEYSQHDPRAYAFTGGLCLAEQGVMEMVEMFKTDPKLLHPMLTATQEGNYNGTEGSPIPFSGTILAHSNESEWELFRNNPKNEAFLDRVAIVKVPYCLRINEEIKIYEKMLKNSDLAKVPCAPGTLPMLAQFSVLTRLKSHENSSLFAKMRVYNGENLKDVDTKAKSMMEYRNAAGVDEGMNGFSTRSAYKVLSRTFNYDPSEVAADPIHLLIVLEKYIQQEQLPEETEKNYISVIRDTLAAKYGELITKEIQTAYIESYAEYGQNLFDRYIAHADAWIQEQDFKNPDTGEMFNREILEEELSKIEKPSNIANPKDFRHEVVNFVLRQRGKVEWTSYEKLREVIERRIFTSTEELLPVISFTTKSTRDEQRKHAGFVERMMKKGYTEKQVRRVVEWYSRYAKHN